MGEEEGKLELLYEAAFNDGAEAGLQAAVKVLRELSVEANMDALPASVILRIAANAIEKFSIRRETVN